MFHENHIFNADYGQETLTTLNKLRLNPATYGWVGVMLTPTSGIFEKQFHRKIKK